MSHTHHHDHGHHHHHAPSNFGPAFALSVALNLIYTIIQIVFAFLAGSMSLMADAGHNLGDVLGLTFAWAANWLQGRPANERYSYGYKRTTILSAIANALILILACVFIVSESIDKLLHPHPIHAWMVVIVAAIGIVINTGTALLFMRGSKDDLNIRAAFLHLASDALVSFGVVIAAIVIYFTGWVWLDPIVGLIIVLIILWSTWGLLCNSVNLILDGVPKNIDQDGVRHFFEGLNGVKTIHDLHIWGLSTREVALTVHLIMPELSLSDEDYLTIRYKLKHDFNINHVTIQVEKGSTDFPCDQCH